MSINFPSLYSVNIFVLVWRSYFCSTSYTSRRKTMVRILDLEPGYITLGKFIFTGAHFSCLENNRIGPTISKISFQFKIWVLSKGRVLGNGTHISHYPGLSADLAIKLPNQLNVETRTKGQKTRFEKKKMRLNKLDRSNLEREKYVEKVVAHGVGMHKFHFR